MSQLTDKKENSEIERIVDLDRMGNNGSAVDIVASDGERAALAKRFGFLGLPAFSARVTTAVMMLRICMMLSWRRKSSRLSQGRLVSVLGFPGTGGWLRR